MSFRPFLLTAVLTVVVTLIGGVPSAYAEVVITDSCSAGGFTGYMRTHTERDGAGTVYKVEYRIVRTVAGGNKANVYWNDGGVSPTLHASTDSGIQDGAWHTLRSANYERGFGGTNFKFVFDKAFNDPVCGESFPLS